MDRKEVFAMLAGAAPECYSIAKAHNWWADIEAPSKKPETVMLMVSELGEVLNAHRRNNRFLINVTRKAWTNEKISNFLNDPTVHQDQFCDIYETFVQDTLEGELADTILRVLGYCGAYNIKLKDPAFLKESTKNFGHDLLKINYWMIDAYHGEVDPEVGFYRRSHKDWSDVLKALVVFCDWYEIDIINHVKWKMRLLEFKIGQPNGKAY